MIIVEYIIEGEKKSETLRVESAVILISFLKQKGIVYKVK